MKIARRMMMGSGIPINQSNKPRPNPTTVSIRCYVRWRTPRMRRGFPCGMPRSLFVVSGFAAIAHDEARRSKAVAGKGLEQLVAIEVRSQSAGREVKRQHVDDVMMRRIGRRSARPGVTRRAARILARRHVGWRRIAAFAFL